MINLLIYLAATATWYQFLFLPVILMILLYLAVSFFTAPRCFCLAFKYTTMCSLLHLNYLSYCLWFLCAIVNTLTGWLHLLPMLSIVTHFVTISPAVEEFFASTVASIGVVTNSLHITLYFEATLFITVTYITLK